MKAVCQISLLRPSDLLRVHADQVHVGVLRTRTGAGAGAQWNATLDTLTLANANGALPFDLAPC